MSALSLVAADTPTLDTGNTAWMLTSAALVLFMTIPGLALFYGGLNRSKGVLNMIMMSFGAFGVIGIVYVLWGYSMSFGPNNVGGLFANPFDLWALKDLLPGAPGRTRRWRTRRPAYPRWCSWGSSSPSPRSPSR
ncbi:hypothetical protein [Branchiibius cervicis]|uniref:hypothetical protein n=1 Tax=Branchiibius cervicis TaxID=908252 RepID=UPI003A8D551E